MIALVAAWLMSIGSMCLVPPVAAPVIDRFREPACAYCAGNRGIEYGTSPGQAVIAAASGTVTFSGVVAGVRFVVVRHGDGLLATYGRLADSPRRVGEIVATGAVIGHATASLYFGLRDHGAYIDPARLLGEYRGRPRLLPIDGTPGRPAPPPRFTCPRVGASAQFGR